MTIELWVDSEDAYNVFSGASVKFAAWRLESDAPSRPQFKMAFDADHYRITAINRDCVLMERTNKYKL